MTMTKRVTVWVVLFACLFAQLAYANAEAEKRFLQEATEQLVKDSVVRIAVSVRQYTGSEVDEYGREAHGYVMASKNGTGFYVADNYIVTNYHVIATPNEKDKVAVMVGGLLGPGAKVVAVDEDKDLALLYVARNKGKDDSKWYPFLVFAKDRDGLEVAAYGFPNGHGNSVPKVDRGHIDDADKDSARIEQTYGNSGSPLVNRYGHVVGVVRSIYARHSSGGGYELLGIANYIDGREVQAFVDANIP